MMLSTIKKNKRLTRWLWFGALYLVSLVAIGGFMSLLHWFVNVLVHF